MMRLRDYQRTAVDKVLADLEEVSSSLIVLPTGGGKTVVFSHIADHFAGFGRVMVLAHREELIYQARDKLAAITNELPDVEMADQYADRQGMYGQQARFVVSSIQTQISGCEGRGRMSRFTPAEFSLVIIDEAHHAPAASYRKVLAHYRQNERLKVLGVTATPDRADEEALGQVFDRVSYVYEINDAINDGWLVPITQRSVVVEGLDFTQIRTTAGDLNGADLAAVMEYEANLHGIAHPTYELAAGRKTLVFAASVAHAERLCEIFNRHKSDCARFVCGTTDEVTRKQTLRDFKEGRFQILTNVGVFTEGFDEPSIEVVAVARPTKSRALFCQMVGRGTRPLPGVVEHIGTASGRCESIAASRKPSLEVFDFVGNAGRHKLMTTADILGGNYSDEVIELAELKAREAGAAVDMRKVLEQAEEELEKRRLKNELARQAEAANRLKLVGKAHYSTEIISAFDVLDLRPEVMRGWDKSAPASEKQIDFLRKHAGIPNAAELSKKHAGQLIGEIMKRWESQTCSVKQAKWLKRSGYPTSLPKHQASEIMNAWAANGWRRPAEALAGAAVGEL